ncbi:P63C domain-containing protein [Lacticaseibacillus yichunensis]|uniref:P63C domain-containing protein n=1 Tax=Lacticaseibacillus yichunensis TaxID=2486015 RepID=A0ABW4CK13_9LACO|nr:P63C domain-containing protein [Lacticaseibacillus yichunensis]
MSNIEEIANSGYVEIGDTKLYSFVTKTGKRLITATDVFNALKRSRRGETRVNGYPTFIGARNIVPFITDDLAAKVQPVKYRAKNGKIADAYDATIIPSVADLYIEAHDKGVLSLAQEEVYQRSLLIIRSLAKVGITALIDEATGYQYDRESQALQKLLSAYLSEDLLKWQAHFPREFYEQVYRLNGISDAFDPANPKRPQWIAGFTNKYVYGIFPEEVMKEIHNRNPLSTSPRNVVYRAHKNFQFLSQGTGLPQLDQHLAKLIGVMMLSDNMTDFSEKFKRVFAKELERKQVQDDIKNGLVPLFYPEKIE